MSNQDKDYLKNYLKEKNEPVDCEICGGRYLRITGKTRHKNTAKHKQMESTKTEQKRDDKLINVKIASVLLEIKDYMDKKINEVLEIKDNS